MAEHESIGCSTPSIPDEEDIIDEDALESDNWIEELECALLADCDPQTLKKICEGKKIPRTLRPDYWRALLALNDIGNIRLTNEFDLPNQLEIRQDCEAAVEEIAHNLAGSGTILPDAVKLRLRSDFECTITTYVKARPEVEYVSGNGWIDILRVLQNLEQDGSQMYQMFFRIVDRYIPKNLAPKRSKTPAQDDKNISRNQEDHYERSAQAFHLMRLLIQYHDPELCSILESKKVTPCAYVRDWFATLFARSCPTQLALHIWDMHFKMADPLLIFFAAIVMVVNASDELKKGKISQSEMLDLLKSMPGKLEEDDIEDLYYLVSNHYTNSTPRSIRSYSHLFFMDTFANTYRGSESPEEGQRLLDPKTTQLISSIDLSQYLCLPIVPAEIFAQDTASSTNQQSNSTHSSSSLRYFLVDCRPAEQYNAGHLAKAFHLDCSLMLREPSSFALSVQALLEIQRQVVSSKSNTGGQHLCFIGSGQDEEDRYVNMVIASFLQKYQKYVSIAHGGFDAIHDYFKAKCDSDGTFNKYVVDHDEKHCKACLSKLPDGLEKWKSSRPSMSHSTTSVGSLLASTTSFLRGDKNLSSSALSKLAQSNPQTAATANMIAQSSISMFDKFTTAFVTKSSVFKDKLVESLNQTNLPSADTLTQGSLQSTRSHVSEQDKLGRRYTGSSLGVSYVGDMNDDDLKTTKTQTGAIEEPCREIQIDIWQKEEKIIALHKCCQIKGSARYPGWIGLSQTHLWILREIPHNKGFASIAAKRPLNMIVQITSKRRQPDCIIFRYGYAHKSPGSETGPGQQPQNESTAGTTEKTESPSAAASSKNLPTIIASDNVQIPQPFDMLRLIKNEIIRIMDETARAAATSASAANVTKQEATSSAEPDASLIKDSSESKGDTTVATDKNPACCESGPAPKPETATEPPEVAESGKAQDGDDKPDDSSGETDNKPDVDREGQSARPQETEPKQ